MSLKIKINEIHPDGPAKELRDQIVSDDGLLEYLNELITAYGGSIENVNILFGGSSIVIDIGNKVIKICDYAHGWNALDPAIKESDLVLCPMDERGQRTNASEIECHGNLLEVGVFPKIEVLDIKPEDMDNPHYLRMKSALAALGIKCTDIKVNLGVFMDADGKKITDDRGNAVSVIFDVGMIRQLDQYEKLYYEEGHAPHYPPDMQRWRNAQSQIESSFRSDAANLAQDTWVNKIQGQSQGGMSVAGDGPIEKPDSPKSNWVDDL
jgi:hypothetical protein